MLGIDSLDSSSVSLGVFLGLVLPQLATRLRVWRARRSRGGAPPIGGGPATSLGPALLPTPKVEMQWMSGAAVALKPYLANGWVVAGSRLAERPEHVHQFLVYRLQWTEGGGDGRP